jgi:MFS family permease
VKYGHPYAGAASGYLIRADIQSGWNGVATVGDVIGIIISGYLLEWVGRKHTLGIGAVLTAVGIGLQIGVQTWRGFMVGRFVNGKIPAHKIGTMWYLLQPAATGFGIVFLVTPIFIGEVCRPEVRGTFLCIINCSIVFGQLILALAAKFCAERTDKWSYQIMILLQFVFCGILLVGYPFFPDSPFYFLNKNRPEKARRSLNRIHGSSDQRLIEAELVRLQDMVKTTRQMQELAGESGPPMLQAFKGKNLVRIHSERHILW